MMLNNPGFETDSISIATEFAFQPPQEYKVPPSESVTSVPYPLTIPSHADYNSVSSATGPFTMSGTVTPVELSSVDTSSSLPRILRDFAPTSSIDSRRPATTTGSLHRHIDDTGNTAFQNPFTSSPTEMVPSQSASVDPHYQPETPTSWHSSSQPLSYPTSAVGVSQGYYSNGLLNPATRTASVARPQTSDGLPSYPSHLNGGVALPPARSLAFNNMSYSSGVSVSPTYSTVGGGQMMGYQTARYGSYDQNAARYLPVQANDSDLHQFVSLPGPIPPRKRSRRRYDEIERIYHCEWKGCDKAYGTLNHLNAHVAMQKHGEKRLPSQFKEMRKEWRKKKRDETNEAENKKIQAQAAAAHQQALAAHHHHSAAAAAAGVDPLQASYHWDARHTTADPTSIYSSYSTSSSNSLGVDSETYGHRDSTTTTVSSGGSPNDTRFPYGNSGSWSNVYDRKPSSMSLTASQSTTASSGFVYNNGMNHGIV